MRVFYVSLFFAVFGVDVAIIDVEPKLPMIPGSDYNML